MKICTTTNQHKTTEASKNSRRTQEKHPRIVDALKKSIKNSRRTQEKHPRTVQNSGSTHEES